MRKLSYILLSALFFNSCWFNPRPNNDENAISIDEALIENSTNRYESELLILDSLSATWGWSPDTLAGGILLHQELDESGSLNTVGDTVLFNAHVLLVNGNECFVQDSLAIIVGHFEGPQMFDEISRKISPGDSIRALVPSNMGFALRGIPGVVPPGAMLLLEIKQLAY